MQKKFLFFVGIGILAISSFGAGFLYGLHKETDAATIFSENTPSADFAPVWKAWQILENRFVSASSTHTISKEDRVWGLIKGLADSYGDPYTSFFPPQEAKNFRQEISGSFGGVGMEIGKRNNTIIVIAPLKGTPAEKAGIRAGDYVVKIDGKSTRDLDVDEAVGAIRGKEGTTVTFTLAREGQDEFLTIPVVRDTIVVPTIATEMRKKEEVFIISLYNFGATAPDELHKALQEFIKTGYTKLVLDLRGNPGGYLEGAVASASEFLPEGKVIVTEDYGGGKSDVYRSSGSKTVPESVHIAVLINGGSASASEILAGALQEHGRAVLVGEKSFGKGSVQEMIPVTDDTALKVTIARWLTPKGNSISENGLIPDIVVPLSQELVKEGKDVQKERAIHFLVTGKKE
jgi:carboxyl-terminal processing protease